MSGYDGNGSFNFTYSWANDAANGIPITASRMDGQFNDAVSGFDLVICRDGQSTTSAIIPFAVGIQTDILSPVTANGPVSVTAGQLKFPATQNPSSNANTLDDYEEGTFTPTDGSGTGVGFSDAAGFYTKIGRQVAVYILVTVNVNANSSDALISGLPFTVLTGTFPTGAVNTDAGITFIARANSATANVVFLDNTNTEIAMSSLSGKIVGFSITYFVS